MKPSIIILVLEFKKKIYFKNENIRESNYSFKMVVGISHHHLNRVDVQSLHGNYLIQYKD